MFSLWIMASKIALNRLPEGKHNAAYGAEARDILWSLYRAAGGTRMKAGALSSLWHTEAVLERQEAEATLDRVCLDIPEVAAVYAALKEEEKNVDKGKVSRAFAELHRRNYDVKEDTTEEGGSDPSQLTSNPSQLTLFGKRKEID